ncbi:hypothetical protein KC361_g118 [Hortaea werneckii]|nr:hypothetical protein KC361_g118 [Hortaea werneckii]
MVDVGPPNGYETRQNWRLTSAALTASPALAPVPDTLHGADAVPAASRSLYGCTCSLLPFPIRTSVMSEMVSSAAVCEVFQSSNYNIKSERHIPTGAD